MAPISYSTIPFLEVETLIRRWLRIDSSVAFELIPNDLHAVISSKHFPLQWNPIPGWDSFAYGNSDFQIHDLITLLPARQQTAQQILIITDSCFMLQQAYLVSNKDLPAFAESEYPNLHREDFLQPLDLILLFPETAGLFLLHHEGRWTSVDFSGDSSS